MIPKNQKKPKLISIFTGENVPLARSELRAVLEGSNYAFEILSEESRFSIVEVEKFDDELGRILARLAYCRYIAIQLGIVPQRRLQTIPRIWRLEDTLSGQRTFSVRAYGFRGSPTRQSIESNVGKIILDGFGHLKVDLNNPQVKVLALRMGEDIVIGHTINDQTKSTWHLRRPRKRVFFYPSAIFPKMARLMVNLCRIREGEIFLDPLVGTGSLTIEASLMGMYSVGIDVIRWICRGARYNLLDLDISQCEVLNADSRNPPIKNVHGIATDFPYGRSTRTLKIDPRALALEVIASSADLLRPGRCFVGMYPKEWGFKDSDFESFKEMERHEIPVHRSLTRVLSVMKRI